MNIEQFLTVLISSSAVTHMMHLQCKGKGSYAAHLALGEFYAEMPGKVDELVECLQAREQFIFDYDYSAMNWGTGDEALDYVKALRDLVEEHRYLIDSRYTNIHDIIEDILTLIDSTIYKLTFLR